MKNLFYLLVGLFFLLFIFSCSKSDLDKSNLFDSQLNQRSKNDIYKKLGISQSDLELFNGDMLWFKDKSTFKQVKSALDQLQKDTFVIREYLNSLGLESSKDNPFASMWNPALSYFESHFEGFNALGKYEENIEKQFYKDNDAYATYNSSAFLYDRSLRFMFNDKYEVKIGDFIYKLVDRECLYLIVNDDLESLNELRSHDNLKKAPLVKNAVFINKRVIEDLTLYKKITGEYDETNARSPLGDPPPCEVDLLVVNFPNSDMFRFFAITNIPNVTYSWLITDNAGQTVLSTQTALPFIDWTPPNNNFPFTVTVTISDGKGCNASDSEVITTTCNCDFTYSITQEDNCVILQFQGIETECPGFGLVVDWGDGTTENFTNIDDVKHCYNNNNEYTNFEICVSLTTDGCDNPPVCKTVPLGCGIGIEYGQNTIYYAPRYKAIIEKYVPWGIGCCLGWEEVSAEITNKYYYHSWFGNFWIISWADKLIIDIELLPIRNTKTTNYYNPNNECNTEERFNGPGYTNNWYTFTTEEIFSSYYDPKFAVRSGECTATFWLINNGQQYGPWALDYAD